MKKYIFEIRNHLCVAKNVIPNYGTPQHQLMNILWYLIKKEKLVYQDKKYSLPREKARKDAASTSRETRKSLLNLILIGADEDQELPNLIFKADICVLVILAVDELDELLDERTRNHVKIAKYVDMKIFVAINNMNDIHWELKRFNKIKDKMEGFPKTNRYMDITFILISGNNDMNVHKKVSQHSCAWCTDCLSDALEAIEVDSSLSKCPFRSYFLIFQLFSG
ncbi:Eukaryotic peptide chain release factor GTP-binding subunit [Artemisia annua]|uniref:Eukaryotic peptide chain release factor GTP-binding subunit n=1 Tax=Artemisia annua TaxID=35608 RepID=A0A2U1QF04_ARTAN|nr:Eukaryotic peptide chain release factor GTP-binding subunit [Artemisia annua]